MVTGAYEGEFRVHSYSAFMRNDPDQLEWGFHPDHGECIVVRMPNPANNVMVTRKIANHSYYEFHAAGIEQDPHELGYAVALGKSGVNDENAFAVIALKQQLESAQRHFDFPRRLMRMSQKEILKEVYRLPNNLPQEHRRTVFTERQGSAEMAR